MGGSKGGGLVREGGKRVKEREGSGGGGGGGGRHADRKLILCEVLLNLWINWRKGSGGEEREIWWEDL